MSRGKNMIQVQFCVDEHELFFFKDNKIARARKN